MALLALALVYLFYLIRMSIICSNIAQALRFVSYGIFYFNKVVLVKYSCAFVERPSQGTSSLASQLTTVSLDVLIFQLHHPHVITDSMQALHL